VLKKVIFRDKLLSVIIFPCKFYENFWNLISSYYINCEPVELRKSWKYFLWSYFLKCIPYQSCFPVSNGLYSRKIHTCAKQMFIKIILWCFLSTVNLLMWRNWNAEIQLWLTQPVHLSLTFRFYSVGENRTCWCYAAGYQSILFSVLNDNGDKQSSFYALFFIYISLGVQKLLMFDGKKKHKSCFLTSKFQIIQHDVSGLFHKWMITKTFKCTVKISCMYRYRAGTYNLCILTSVLRIHFDPDPGFSLWYVSDCFVRIQILSVSKW
jgi:hypothetical protein